jgi:hypothetical protein
MPQRNHAGGTSTAEIALAPLPDFASLPSEPNAWTTVRHLKANCTRLAASAAITPGHTDHASTER